MSQKLIVAHHFTPATGKLLSGHPLVGEVRAIDPERRWDLPLDADVIFALHAQSEAAKAAERTLPPPPGWPGKVRLVQIASAGLDGYPDWLLDAPNVATGAGTSAGPIAEFVLAAMLAQAKRFPEIYLTDGAPWPSSDTISANPLGTLEGKTLGLVGVGQIGARIARLAQAFGMTVLAARKSDAPMPEGVERADLATLLARADHIALAAPAGPDTARLLNAETLAQTKRGVHIVNIARGSLIDTAALIAALESGQVAAASLDVTDPEPLPPGHPLWRAPNVHITPHISWSSAGTPARIFKRLLDNIARVAAGEPVLSPLAR